MQNQTIRYNINWKRLAVAIPMVAVVHMLLLYGLFMNPASQDVIFSESMGQSAKLIAVWNTLEPVPSEMSLIPALIITPMIFSFLFAVLYQSIPGKGILQKGFFYGIMWWGTVAIFFELFTPLGLFWRTFASVSIRVVFVVRGFDNCGNNTWCHLLPKKYFKKSVIVCSNNSKS